MNSLYNFSAYSNAITSIDSLDEDRVKFHYGDASFSKFCEHFNTEDKIARKCLAVPLVLIGVVKLVYHVAMGLIGIPSAIKGENNLFRGDVYRIARELEWIGGWVLTIFYDELGSYFVQESLFHKSRYEQIENGKLEPKSRATFDGIDIVCFEETSKITLLDFRNMSEEKREKAIQKYELQENIDLNPEFFKRLNEADEEALTSITLFELQMNRVSFALMSDEELIEVKLKELSWVEESEINYILGRLKSLRPNKSQYKPQDDVFETSILNTQLIDINAHIENLNSNQMRFLSDDQLAELDTSKMSKSAIQLLFPYEQRHRLLKLSPDQINGMVDRLSIERLNDLSDEQLSRLQLSKCTESLHMFLFSYDNKREMRRRFALLDIKELNLVLPSLSKHHYAMFSITQLEAVDLSGLHKQELDKFLWCNQYEFEQNRDRAKALSADQINPVVDKLDRSLFELLSEKHLRQLKISKLKELNILTDYKNDPIEAKRRFAFLPIDEINMVIAAFSQDLYDMLSVDQVKGLDYQNVDINKLFPTIDYEDIFHELRHTIQGVSETIVNGFLSKMIIDGLSQEQITQVLQNRKAMNRARYEALSDQQRAEIRVKLTPANLAFLTN